MKNTIEPVLVEQQVVLNLSTNANGNLNSDIKTWEPKVLIARVPKHLNSLIYTNNKKYNFIALNKLIKYKRGNPKTTFYQLFGNQELDNLKAKLFVEYHQLLLQKYSIQTEIYFHYSVNAVYPIKYLIRSISHIN